MKNEYQQKLEAFFAGYDEGREGLPNNANSFEYPESYENGYSFGQKVRNDE